MTNHLARIAGICALSAAMVAGMSLRASNARAAEEDEDVALNADNNESGDIDEGTTAESGDAIHRGYYRRYPGSYYRWPGYRLYPPPGYYNRYYRNFNPRYRYYRSPFYGGPVCGPYGCIW